VPPVLEVERISEETHSLRSVNDSIFMRFPKETPLP
jgi:hypothetical protein